MATGPGRLVGDRPRGPFMYPGWIRDVSRVRIPTPVFIFFILDVVLGVAYIFDYLAGHPYRPFAAFLDLNGEGNLPTWYSSIQWFCVATLLGIFAHNNLSPSRGKSWLFVLLPLVFLALSLDEVAQIHEWLGRKSDKVFLPGGSRKNTPFAHTGIWMLVFGVPFLAGFVALTLAIRSYFQRAPSALVKILLGMAVTLVGALGVETFYSFVAPNSGYGILQGFSEELCEMLGGTIVLWGSYELLARHGFTLRLERAETDQVVPPGRRSGGRKP